MKTTTAGALFLSFVLLSLGSAHADEVEGLKAPQIIFLSVDDYVRLALKQSDRALTAYNNFENSSLDNRVSIRGRWLPSLDLASEVSKTKTDVNSSVTYNESAEGSATLSQPFFPSGARISASLSESVDRTDAGAGSVSHSYTRPSYSASITQPLFLFVGNSDWRTWRRSRLNFDIAADNFKRDLQSIENDARSNYFDVLLKISQLNVEKIKLESAKRGHAITKALVDAGRLAGIELSRSNLRLQQDIRRFRNAETSLQQSINDAMEFVSLKIESKIEFTSRLEYDPLGHSLNTLIDFALEHRPDYIAARRQLKLGELSIKEALENNNPTLNAVASLSRSDSGTGNPPDTTSKSWSGGINLSWPLFDAGITNLRAQQARNDLKNQKVAFNGLERSIRTEVSNAYLDIKRTEQQLEDLRTSKAQARQSVDAVRIRYQNGRDRLIDVFDSEQQLRDLELEYLNVLISAQLAKDRLALLVGAPLSEVSK